MNTVQEITRFFANKDRQVRIWMLFSTFSVVIYSTVCWQLVRESKQETGLVIIDGETVLLASPTDIGKAEELHHAQTALAIETVFNRHPGGIDHPERLNKLFEKEALDKANKAIAADREEFHHKRIHQKAEIKTVKITKIKGDTILVHATGQLIRSGVFESTSFTEGLDFEANFAFKINRSLISNRRYPTLVHGFNFKITAKPNP